MRFSGRSPLVVAIALAAACGHHTGSTASPKATDAAPPPLIKSVAVSFQSQVDGAVSHVFLAAMDETGKTISYPVGDVPGTCASIKADGADLITLECKGTAGTVRVHAIQQGSDVVVLRETIAAGGKPDAMNRDELGRFPMPVDAKVEAGG